MLQNKIRELRQQKGYSQEALSSLTGIPQTTLSNWELGSINQVLSKAVLLAATLETNIDTLIAESPKPDKELNMCYKCILENEVKRLIRCNVKLENIQPEQLHKNDDSLVKLVEAVIKLNHLNCPEANTP